MKNREKTENIGQTMKNDDARRKTHEKKSNNGRVQKEKKDILFFKKMTTEKFELFSRQEKAETEMKKKG